MTEAAKRDAKRRRDRIAAGKCSECGNPELDRNLNGSKSTRCRPCKTMNNPHGYDPEAPYDYRDSDDYKACCAIVREKVTTAAAHAKGKPGVTIPELKRLCPTVPYNMAEIVESLSGAGLIDGSWTLPVRYVQKTLVARVKSMWDKTIHISKNGTPRPDDEVYQDRRISA